MRLGLPVASYPCSAKKLGGYWRVWHLMIQNPKEYFLPEFRCQAHTDFMLGDGANDARCPRRGNTEVLSVRPMTATAPAKQGGNAK